MKTIETKEELQIIQDVENGKYVPLKGQERESMIKALTEAARNTVANQHKEQPIRTRVTESDIDQKKAFA